MLIALTLFAICLTLIPGITYFLNERKRRIQSYKWDSLDQQIKALGKNGDPEMKKQLQEERVELMYSTMKTQGDIARSNYFLAAGACSFAILELYKFISHLLESLHRC